MPLVAGGVLGLVVIAVAAIILLSGSSSSDPNAVYRQKLTSVLAPVVSANTALSTSLQALRGANTRDAQNAASQAQSAITAARGAVAVLTVPNASGQLSQQVQEALTQENGYLQAVAATVAAPTGVDVSGLQGLASSTASAFIPLASVAPRAQVSLYGTDALVKWAQAQAAAQKHRDAAAQRKALQKAARSGQHPPVTPPPQTPPVPQPNPTPNVFLTPSGDPVPGSWGLGAATFATGVGAPYPWSSGQNRDQNIFAGSSTSCGFADDVFKVVAAASHYNSLIPGSITASSPDGSTTLSLTCTEYWGTDNQADLQCITADGAGTAFPVWASNVYYN